MTSNSTFVFNMPKIIAIALFLMCRLAYAEKIQGTIDYRDSRPHPGTIRTQKLGGAFIFFTEIISGAQFSASTDHSGSYGLDLPVGRYYITVQHPNYETYSSHWSTFHVQPNSNHVQNFTLKSLTQSTQTGYQGIVARLDSSCQLLSQGAGLARIDFTSEDFSKHFVTRSDSYATYQINLPTGRYFVNASAQGLFSYSSSPGFFVVEPGSTNQIGNIPLGTEKSAKLCW